MKPSARPHQRRTIERPGDSLLMTATPAVERTLPSLVGLAKRTVCRTPVLQRVRGEGR